MVNDDDNVDGVLQTKFFRQWLKLALGVFSFQAKVGNLL